MPTQVGSPHPLLLSEISEHLSAKAVSNCDVLTTSPLGENSFIRLFIEKGFFFLCGKDQIYPAPEPESLGLHNESGPGIVFLKLDHN